MPYFNDIVEELKATFPWVINEIEWDNTLFYMGGENWNFNTSADWVVVNDDIMVIGCHDDDIQVFITKQLVGKKVIALQYSMDRPCYDPVFVVEGGIKLKFFSTTIIEPWTLRLKDRDMFVASPSDIHWNLK